MSMLPLIVDFLLQGKPQQSNDKGIKVLGYFLILVGMLSSFYFLFKTLVPHLGYGESGILMCGVILVSGYILIITNRPKPIVHPINNLIETTSHALKSGQVQDLVEKNGVKFVMLALLAGFVLSQMHRKA